MILTIFFDTIQRLIINIILDVDYYDPYPDYEEIEGGRNYTKDINGTEEILTSSNTTSLTTRNTTIGKIDPILLITI